MIENLTDTVELTRYKISEEQTPDRVRSDELAQNTGKFTVHFLSADGEEQVREVMTVEGNWFKITEAKLNNPKIGDIMEKKQTATYRAFPVTLLKRWFFLYSFRKCVT